MRSAISLATVLVMERSQGMLFLLVACLIAVLIGYGLRVHYRHKGKAPPELKLGVKVLSDPESVVRDLEK